MWKNFPDISSMVKLQNKLKFSSLFTLFLRLNLKPLWYTTLIKKFQEFIQKIKNTNLFIKINIVPFKVLLADSNALMLALDQILQTFFIFGFQFGHQSHLRFFHYLLLVAKSRPPEWFFESIEQEEVTGSQISRIRWPLDGIRSVRPRVTWFPQIRSFLANWFTQCLIASK